MKAEKLLVGMIVFGMVLNIVAGGSAMGNDNVSLVIFQAILFGANGCNLGFTIRRMVESYGEAIREKLLYDQIKQAESVIDSKEKTEI